MQEENATPYKKIVTKMDARGKLLRFWHMDGGVSAQVTAIEMETWDNQNVKLIVRRHGIADRQRDPHIARHEFQLLSMLREQGIAVAEPYFVDDSGEVFADPYIVMSFAQGETNVNPQQTRDYVEKLAMGLARIHGVECTREEVSFLGNQQSAIANKLETPPVALDETLDEGIIRNVLNSVWPLSRTNRDCLLHGDFWPGNILWKNGELIAIIDWEDAAWGDPLSDVGNARLEVLWAFGHDAMAAFTVAYTRFMPNIDMNHLPYWDLCAALRPASQLSHWGLGKETETRMRKRHSWFVRQAIESSSLL
ncbi:phosphotransferase family protein [Paenibacillus sp. L3-i20]|uniref:phosphotransferase family protein n=1 Tax=Paenibacillus sp. L3-i20 TaxID=2905833 RepID=UPI001EE07450|nr:phosphotransferase [Paenibacillus sp. L3-i20]GKU77478.1 hypothetical protein L3i20_v218750 [Paenibacillus sp. L3-i20]